MKNIILISIVLGLGILFGNWLYQDPGYVLLNYKEWVIEGPIWLFIIAALLFFALLLLTLKICFYLLNYPEKYRQWVAQRRKEKARRMTLQGLIELSEGNWAKAEQLLTKYINQDTALINYLASAKAAQEQGAYERRDEHLRHAHLKNPKADIAVGLTQAQLQLTHKQYEQSLATLMHLRRLAPKHKYVLKLLYKLYYALEEWENLQELLPHLKKNKVLTDSDYTKLEKEIYFALLSTQTLSAQRLIDIWRRAPSKIRQEKEAILLYCQNLLSHREGEEVEVLLRDAIKHNWDNDLITVYGIVKGPNPQQQLQTAESWLEGQPNNSVLLLALGRLSLKAQLWGKARKYLEASITFSPSVEGYRELGALLENLGEAEQSVDCYRKGLSIATESLPELPMPVKAEDKEIGVEKRIPILGA